MSTQFQQHLQREGSSTWSGWSRSNVSLQQMQRTHSGKYQLRSCVTCIHQKNGWRKKARKAVFRRMSCGGWKKNGTGEESQGQDGWSSRPARSWSSGAWGVGWHHGCSTTRGWTFPWSFTWTTSTDVGQRRQCANFWRSYTKKSRWSQRYIFEDVNSITWRRGEFSRRMERCSFKVTASTCRKFRRYLAWKEPREHRHQR